MQKPTALLMMSALRHTINTLVKSDDCLIGYQVQEQPSYTMASSKKQDDYVTAAATAPRLCKQLIKKSKRHNPFLDSDWDSTTFDDIDWKSV